MNSKKDILYTTILTILYIVCFPINPLTLTSVIEVNSYLALNILGGVVWVFGMVLIIAPIVMFPRRGGVPKGKSFVKTTRLVDTGIYAVVRHPQYTGGIFSIFLTTLLLYPHWLFGLLGVIAAVLTYLSIREEDKVLVEKFGSDYTEYKERVPGMNFVAGTIRLLRRRRNQNHKP
jgi:protein-S-isoprenylcysteine O-methyltransferase Ste14